MGPSSWTPRSSEHHRHTAACSVLHESATRVSPACGWHGALSHLAWITSPVSRCLRRSRCWPRPPSAGNSSSRSEQDSRETGEAERLAAERGDADWLRTGAARIKTKKPLRGWRFVVCCRRDAPRHAAGLQGLRHGSISLGAAHQQGVGRARHRPEFPVGTPERTTVNPAH